MLKKSVINFYGLFLSITLLANSLQAQEVLVGLTENTSAVKGIKTKAGGILSIPFVDDFSKSYNHNPNNNLWESSSIFVNNTYAINPPSIGVATFDAFDESGNVYAGAGKQPMAADNLTSLPINLSYSASDSLLLSFFIQPKGYGDMPEPNDLLTLEFYSPSTNLWELAWSASVNYAGDSVTLKNHFTGALETKPIKDSVFTYATVKIDSPYYLQNGFKFKFTNYVSIGVNDAFAGRSTSSDHWHLDYVYLNKGRRVDDTRIPDIAISLPQNPLSSRYESIPASHLTVDAKNELFPSPMVLHLRYVNLGWGSKSVTREFNIKRLYGSGSNLSYSGRSENIYENQTLNFSYSAPQYQFSATGDSAALEIESFITTDTDTDPFRTTLRSNDTVRYTQWFRDHYAYDDGTAENGYSLFGSGTANAQVAVKFFCYKTDSLRGAYIYFNKALNEANNDNFSIAIWEDDGGKPGSIIHRETGAKPTYGSELNKFAVFKFKKPVYISKSQTYYIGWIQTSENFLNIGFDRNRNHRAENFYNLGRGWEESTFEGSLMLRPIFCKADKFPKGAVELTPDANKTPTGTYTAYPIPTQAVLYISEESGLPVESKKIELYNTNGRLVKVFNNAIGNIDVQGISKGIYLMKIINKDGKEREVKTIIISE